MNAMYNNAWPEEQQHLKRQQDLIREAEQGRLVRLAKGEAERAPERELRFYTILWGRLRCRLSSLVAHSRPATAASDCAKA